MIEVRLQRDYNFDGLGIWIFDTDPLTKDIVHVVKPMEMVLEPRSFGEMIQPSLRIGRRYEQSFLKAFAESLDTENIKTESDHKIQGTLEATRFHLEDLRVLLKLKK